MAQKSSKRKRASDDGLFSFSHVSGSGLGPVLVSFPAIQPPNSTSFQCYRLNNLPADSADFADLPTIVAAETDAVEYFPSAESSAVGCKYLVAIHNKRTGQTAFRPAPIHVLTRQVKRLKRTEAIPVTLAQRIEARNALGATFGTKKAKAAIRAQERNRVDVDAMQGVAGHLQSTIENSTGNLPTQEEAEAAADENRLIPAFNAAAERPEDIYAIQAVIKDAEWNSVSLSALMKAESYADRKALLPFTRSKWIEHHLEKAFEGNKPNRTTLKLLFCISSMFAFHNARRIVSEKEKLRERLSRIPATLLDGLLSRFTESPRGSTEARTTSATETMLLTYMFALCLRVDEFASDSIVIASDLSMSVPKVNSLFRTLGCKIEHLKPTDLQRLRLPESAGQSKRAILKAPVEFPKPRAKRRT